MKKCKKCGAQIPLKARKCQFCEKSQGGDTALIAIGIIFAFIVVLAALSLLASDDNTEEISGGNNSNLGNYIVDIVSCRIAEDYEGKPVVIVKYKFTNNSDNAEAFLYAIDANVYQNGIGLNEAWSIDASANYDNSNQTKEIKKGATLEVEVAYKLNDTKTDIEVEVEESFSLNGNKITKMFSFR